MVNPFLSKTTGLLYPTPQNNIIKPAKPQPEQQKQKTDYNKYVIGGLSLIAFGTTAGMIYFARQNVKLNKNLFKSISDGNKTTTPVIKFYEQTTSSIPITTQNTGFASEMVPPKNWSSTSTKDINISIEQKMSTKKPVVPAIIPDISRELQKYLITCEEGKINPEKVDEILTKAVGEENVYERRFWATPLHPRGRVKHYTSPNGRRYVLETHETFGKSLTRLYMYDVDKSLRAYLFPDGSFRLNSFRTDESHFITTAKGKRWMEKSRFLNNGAKPNN